MYSERNTIYFTGAQSQILINDKVVTQAVQIEGSMNVGKLPLYGYASHFFDTIATGKVLVSGFFKINYVFDGYLLAFLNNNFKQDPDKTGPDNGTTNTLNLESFDKQLFGTDDKSIEYLKNLYWGENSEQQAEKRVKNLIRPEMTKLFNIKIRDFRIGYGSPQNLENATHYEEKIIVNCSIDDFGTTRDTDESPTMEYYKFIAQNII